jgi:hypothetical protein
MDTNKRKINTTKMWETVDLLEAKVTSLMAYIKQKTNVHAPIKEGLAEITNAVLILADLRKHDKGICQDVAETGLKLKTKATQTSSLTEAGSPKEEEKWRKVTSKRAAKAEKAKKGKRESRDKEDFKNKKVKEEKSQKGKGMSRKEKTRQLPGPRNDAIEVKAKGNASYAETLRRIRKNVVLPNVEVAGIRQTRSGDLLLQMKRGTGQTEELANAITKALGEGAQVRKLTPSVIVEIRDIDGATDGIELMDALTAASPRMAKDAKIISLRPAFSGTQLAVIRLPRDASADFIKGGKIRIGWVNCRLRPRAHLPRCFKCHGFGHLAADCTSPEDRSKECNRCGTEGHKAAVCTNKPNCRTCANLKKSCDHQTGSRNCAALRAALEDKKKKK